MNDLNLQIEALIFVSEKPVQLEEICKTLELKYGQVIDEELVQNIIDQLIEKYNSDVYSFCIQRINRGYCFTTKDAFYDTVSSFHGIKNSKKLSVAALETLAIIAYKQPITKAEIEQIRGVNADYTVHKLLEKELIIMKGRSDTPGRPVLYATSEYFMEHFGINKPEDLPRLKELEVSETTEATIITHDQGENQISEN